MDMIGKLKLFVLGCVIALPLYAADNSQVYFDKDLNPVEEEQASFRYAPFKANDDGIAAVKIYYKNSKQIYLKTQGRINDQGKLEYSGAYQFFTSQGQLSEEGQFKNGKRDGEGVTYDDSGAIKYRTIYQNGLIQERKELHEGKLYRLETYEYDPQNSKNYTWRCVINEKITCVERFVNGLQEGLQEYDDKFQGLRREFNFVAGKKHGLVSIYIDEKLHLTENYHTGKLHGSSREYGKNGQVIYEKNYQHGKLKETMEYFDNGNIQIKTHYENDEKPVSYDKYRSKGSLLETMRSDEQQNQFITRYGKAGETAVTLYIPHDTTQWIERLTYSDDGRYLSERYKEIADTKQKHVRQFYPSGIVKAEIKVQSDGSRYDKSWTESGALRSEQYNPISKKEWKKEYYYFEDGSIEYEDLELRSENKKLRRKFNQDGVLVLRIEYVNHKKQGEQVSQKRGRWGDFLEHTHYHNGQRHGLFKRRTLEDELIAEGQYVNNRKSGVWQQIGFERLPIPKGFSPRRGHDYRLGKNGMKMRLIENYHNGRLHGKYQFMDQNGEILIDGSFKQGKPAGNWLIKHNADGEVIHKTLFENGKQTGQWIVSDFRFNLSIKGHYAMGKKTGQWQSVDLDGNLLMKGHFENGSPVGEWQSYYDNGQLKCRMSYKEGQPAEKWEHYNQSGELLWNQFVKFGELSIDSDQEASLGSNWYRDNTVGIPNDCYINVGNYFALDDLYAN